MSSSRLDRLLRRISPDVVTRSYLAKFALVVLVVIAAIGAVGAVTYAETTDQLEATAQEDYTAVAELSATGSTGGRAPGARRRATSRTTRRSPRRRRDEPVPTFPLLPDGRGGGRPSPRRPQGRHRTRVEPRRFRTPAPPSRVRSGSTITCCTATKSPPRRRTRSTASSGSPTSP